MSIIQKQVAVSQEADALFSAVVSFIAEVKKDLAAGGGIAKNIAPIAAEAFKDFPAIVSNMTKLGDDLKENRSAFFHAATLAGDDLLDLFIPVAVAPAPVPPAAA